ncbi:spore cortex biosynthesis protein YabQ [Desulfosporosinus sp. FKA]|uniref:spore cortex biosynthesis protein YabQ n=1 Tax=Desulfosporosinus sp. FKA TaxID=1969834 RepID=UPI00249E172B|nr:spore cortex biosynthesis protein YabQ [Desulfosporosinus sp. FKA]
MKSFPQIKERRGKTISEFMAFFWVVAAGLMVGVVFDFFRTFRRWQKWGPVVTFVGDILFSLIALVILYRLFFKANALSFRFYNVWGSLLGLVLYLRIFSSSLKKGYFKLFQLAAALLKLFAGGVMIPVRGFVLLMRPPYAILCWFSLLCFRIGEHIIYRPLVNLEITIKEWWRQLWPPRTNG